MKLLSTVRRAREKRSQVNVPLERRIKRKISHSTGNSEPWSNLDRCHRVKSKSRHGVLGSDIASLPVTGPCSAESERIEYRKTDAEAVAHGMTDKESRREEDFALGLRYLTGCRT